MKKIDRLMLTSFIGPFVVSFGIALFVLIMQFLWLYIDEIAGKGVSIFIMLELLGYMSISTFQMALPIATLIASVMVMGNLAERYELSSMKSAGVSLLRVMRGLIIAAALLSVFSYITADFVMPISNLKFKSRLYDIRKQKPALTLEKGIFNEDFRQFVIRIGKKERDGETIGEVMIEDQTNLGQVKFNQILADSGQMFTSPDKRFFVMNLFKGTQYQEPGSQSPGAQKQRYPFVRTNFSSWTKVWDMREFEMVRTDEDRFNRNRSTLSMDQLRHNLDSLVRTMQDGKNAMADDYLATFKRISNMPPKDSASLSVKTTPAHIERPANSTRSSPGPVIPRQKIDKPLEQYQTLLQTFVPEDTAKLLMEARNRANIYKTTLETRQSQVESRRKEWVKTGYELYIKYCFALVCFVFVFIGGPMGAIIRKGGFGYPILVSIIFFVTFIMLTIMCRKLAEAYVLTPFWAAMVPCIVLMPIAFILTRKGMNDAQMFSTERLERAWIWLRKRFQKTPQAL